MDFSGKVVLITGASSGIGAATAVHFATLKALLVLTGRNKDNLFKTAVRCTHAGSPEVYPIVADLTNEFDVERIFKDTIGKFGKLNVLINNAGILENGSIESTSIEQYERLFSINVKSVYHMTMLAIPHLLISKGSIVNVSSVAGTKSFPGILAYCMSKAAVDQLTKCVALEVASKGVRVNSVNPGVILTEIHRRSGMNQDDYIKFLENCKETHALGRPGETNEVANAIAFLASDEASFITGELLHVDGGRHAMCPR